MGSLAEHSTVRSAADRLIALTEQVRIGKSAWHPNAWVMIINKLKDEGQFMRECDPSGTCSYEFTLELAVEYLIQMPNRERYKQVMSMVMEDMRLFTITALKMGKEHFSADDDRILTEAIKEIVAVMGKLRNNYPDPS